MYTSQSVHCIIANIGTFQWRVIVNNNPIKWLNTINNAPSDPDHADRDHHWFGYAISDNWQLAARHNKLTAYNNLLFEQSIRVVLRGHHVISEPGGDPENSQIPSQSTRQKEKKTWVELLTGFLTYST